MAFEKLEEAIFEQDDKALIESYKFLVQSFDAGHHTHGHWLIKLRFQKLNGFFY
ncbi:hypothetical protein MATR_17080 [Marivirga tractuosa]|uniref:Uncharacterized protein n=1 Tax=Marivirga tractuosa (strain ATCC 23168 / DSM 4126 / NBRC 15989 / NCIMB 1408 / VKM B-1430 / H-43) TaxID=643867 RepID=E4TRD3_MARTH|nr:hypothetical protein [Marivirga tractuosa]ADR20667.1 hypothetical protein Ftrac_0665 [Marivirga tractuosa DSM 4126]BDD14883.1 hypothetical protein MATR_17080 [Marivirga tractuosa]